MERRTYLGAVGASGVASIAGCLDSVLGFGSDGDSSRTVLGPPEQSRGEPTHPIHGDDLPSFSVSDPLSGETISADQFHGEQAILMTFFLINCPSNLCPALLQRLRAVQDDASSRGYEDEIALLAMTFDPERDTPEALESQADAIGLDLDAGNFHFLRPETNEEAHEIVQGRFGTPVTHDHGDDGGNGHDDHGNDDHGNENTDDHGQEDTDDHDDHGNDENQGGDGDFTHYYILLLANDQGVVERSYPNATDTSLERLTEDVRTVIGY